MKSNFTILLALFCLQRLQAQAFLQPDTLVFENFQSDPTPLMLGFPSGNDQSWVNYNGDVYEAKCVEGTTPNGWYWEGDLGYGADPNNYAFTSCSYLSYTQQVYNNNWLILPPLFVPDSSYFLNWQSMSFAGPAYHDGYRVVVSTGSNSPDDGEFTHVIFRMADMLFGMDPDDTNPAHFNFTPGYIQANTYTDTNYYALDVFEEAGTTHPFLHGKLEPHSVSLKDFVGQTIYIAFHHNARNNWMMQLDDINIAQNTTAIRPGPEGLTAFVVSPNPASTTAQVRWKLNNPVPTRISLMDMMGKTIWISEWHQNGAAEEELPLESLPQGTYFVVLDTKNGRATRKLTKI